MMPIALQSSRMPAIDARRFPALAAYVGNLPAGLRSYPEAQTKGIVLRSSVSGRYFHPAWNGLPDALTGPMRSPPLPTAWVPTVITDAVFCAVADAFYPSDEAVVKWNFDRTMGLSRVPMYSALAKLAGLERFIRTAARVHAHFQRGTDLIVQHITGGANLHLRHSPHLHGRLNHLSNEGVFQAALLTAGARGASVKLVESTSSLARYEARWQA